MANYVILGKTFTNVNGIKATDTGGNEVVYTDAPSDLDELLAGTLTSYSDSTATSLRTNLFKGQTHLNTVNTPNVTSVGNGCFDGCTNLSNLTTGTLTYVGQYAFRNVPISQLNISSSLTQIKDYAFYGTGITAIPNQNSLTSIGIYAFGNCNGITEVTLSSTITSLYANIFNGCSNLSKVYYNTSAANSTGIFDGAALLTKISTADEAGTIIVPTTMTTTPSYLGAQTSNIQIIDLTGCTGLTTISYMFGYNSGNLRSVLLPDSVTTVEEYFCGHCYSQQFTSLVWPEQITAIGSNVCSNNSNLVLHDFRNSVRVPTLGNNSFRSLNANCKIVVPDALYADWIVANNWSSVASYIIKASDYTP